MNIKKLAIIILCALMLLSAAACSFEGIAKGAIKTGAWSEDGKTFTNEWSNIKFSLPSGWRAMSSEEISAQVGAGTDVLVNEGMSQSEVDVSKLKTAYDFALVSELGIPQIMMFYENLALTPGNSSIDETAYHEILKTQILAVTQITYKDEGTSTKTVAGEEYLIGRFSAMDGLLCQDYYLRRLGKVMIAMIVTYTPETKAEADRFIASITAAG